MAAAVKVGLIARSEDKGLGNLTWEFAQHMQPERVLLVVPNHRLIQRPDRFPDATTLQWNHRLDSFLDEKTVRAWLDGLDIVYSAETFYDWRVCTWAREQGVRTVCHVMPEFYRHGQPDPPVAPDVWWTPTRWRLDHLDPQTRIVPVPIATERFRRPEWLASADDPADPARRTVSDVTHDPCANPESAPSRQRSNADGPSAGPTPTSTSDAGNSPGSPASDAADQRRCITTTTPGRSTSGGSAENITSQSTNVRRETSGPPRWLHIGGMRAANDRNGTRTLIDALRFLKREHHVRIRTQGERQPRVPVGRGVKVEVCSTPTAEYWELYDDADMLVLPRRYAGLSLPALEAMAAGLGLVMSDAEPQRSEWPIVAVPSFVRGHVVTSTGKIPMAEVAPKVLAGCMDLLADDTNLIVEARARAWQFAQSQSWDRLAPMIVTELEAAT